MDSTQEHATEPDSQPKKRKFSPIRWNPDGLPAAATRPISVIRHRKDPIRPASASSSPSVPSPPPSSSSSAHRSPVPPLASARTPPAADRAEAQRSPLGGSPARSVHLRLSAQDRPSPLSGARRAEEEGKNARAGGGSDEGTGKGAVEKERKRRAHSKNDIGAASRNGDNNGGEINTNNGAADTAEGVHDATAAGNGDKEGKEEEAEEEEEEEEEEEGGFVEFDEQERRIPKSLRGIDQQGSMMGVLGNRWARENDDDDGAGDGRGSGDCGVAGGGRLGERDGSGGEFEADSRGKNVKEKSRARGRAAQKRHQEQRRKREGRSSSSSSSSSDDSRGEDGRTDAERNAEGRKKAGRQEAGRQEEEGSDYERELNRRELEELANGVGDGGGSGDEEEGSMAMRDTAVAAATAAAAAAKGGEAAGVAGFISLLRSSGGCRSVDEFERLNRIDEGTYGVVYRARDKKTGRVVALKKVKMEREKEGFPLTSLREINILLSLRHEAVVGVREVVVGSSVDSIFMVMEYMDHDVKSLMESMKQAFSPSEVKCLMLQLLSGVAYMHDNWVLHRDLKTSNLLLNNRGELKICDFGLARQYGSPLRAYTHMVVTLWYRAPELLLGVRKYSTAVDMWSAGCIMAELLCKEPLLPGKSELDQIDKIFKLLGTPTEKIWPEFAQLPSVKRVSFVRQPYNRLRERFPAVAFSGKPALSDAGFDLLNRMLTYDPAKRITAAEALQHEWFREVPLPKSQELMPTFPGRNEQDRRLRRLQRSPDPLKLRGAQNDAGMGLMSFPSNVGVLGNIGY
ncbi:hypothetical protein CLOM_g8838 [Closterium sp. NIES-68]|nr:hypothetical protein CLOM_g8838 [Closterium sp. NIES-68]